MIPNITISLQGINEENSEYHLRKGETFKTPALALTYSKEGLSGASRNFHKWGRKYILAHGNQERDILLNSWEGVYFGINQQRMDQMMADIHSMGGELFVMDGLVKNILVQTTNVAWAIG